MKAVVMAGGEGSRLRPLTIGRPKPMVPMASQPVMGHILDLLKRQGITDVVVTLHYMPDAIQGYFGEGKHLGMNIRYAIEEVPLGTAGSVKNAQEFLDEPFIIISGDAVTDLDLQQVIAFHRQKKARATLTLYRVPNPLEYGVIITDGEGRITQFLEKPSWGEVISDTVNTGIYVIEPDVLELIEPGKSVDWSKDVFPRLLADEQPLYGFVADGYWTDVGDISEYVRATNDVLAGIVKTEPLGEHIGGGIWCDEGVHIAPDAQLYGPVYLGREVQVKGGVIIHGPSVIRDYSIVDSRAHIDRSLIWRNTYVGEGVEVRGAIVGRQCTLKSRSVLFEGVVLGDNCVVGENAIIHPNVKVWPGKEIEPGATVKASIIWGARGRRVLFGRFGVTGVVNVDMTPEFAAKLGAAFAATLPKGSMVTMNRDVHRSPRMIKRAAISGLPSGGVHVVDLHSMPLPVARYYTKVTDAIAGVHVRLSPFDQRVVDIKFLDADGHNLSKDAERGIERIFFREDFRRVYLDDIGTIRDAPQVIERYTHGFLGTLQVEAVRKARLKIVIDYAHSPTSEVLPPILNALGVDVVPLNAHIDESKMAIPHTEFEQGLRDLATITGALSTNLGVRLDVGGERIFLVDEAGQRLPEVDACAAMAELALRANPGSALVVPVNLPDIFETIAGQHGGRVIRCKVDPHDMMEAAAQQDVVMAGDGTGSFVFPQFQSTVDGLMALAKLLEFLASQGVRLSEVVKSLPPYYLQRRSVSCPWEAKGTVMRLLNQQYKGQRTEMIDGIKVRLRGDEWVLVLPDPDQPLFHVFAESASEADAVALVDKYARIIEGLQD